MKNKQTNKTKKKKKKKKRNIKINDKIAYKFFKNNTPRDILSHELNVRAFVIIA